MKKKSKRTSKTSKPSRSEIKVMKPTLDLKEKENYSKESIIQKIDELLNQMKNLDVKTVITRIFYYYKENDYKELSCDEIVSKLTNEYKSNPSNFLNKSNRTFNSLRKFTNGLKFSLKNNKAFNPFKVKGTDYIKLNYHKAYETLKNMNKRISKKEVNSLNTTMIEKDEESDISSLSSISSQNKEKTLMGKKRKRNKSNQRNSKPREKLPKEKKYLVIDEVNSTNKNTNDDNDTEIDSINSNEDNQPENKTMDNNTVYFQGTPLKNNNLTNMSFYGGNTENSKYFYSNSLDISPINNYNFDIQNSSTNEKVKILYSSKLEEKFFTLLFQEVKPMMDKFDFLNKMILSKQERLSSITILLTDFETHITEYKNIKKKFLADCNILEICFNIIENQAKILKMCRKTDYIPYKDDVFNLHSDFVKKYIDKCKYVLEDNEKKIIKLNDYEINFRLRKVTIENEVEELLGNNCDIMTDEIIKMVIKPKLFKYFNRMKNAEDASNNDYKFLYDKNVKLKETYEKCMTKVESI